MVKILDPTVRFSCQNLLHTNSINQDFEVFLKFTSTFYFTESVVTSKLVTPLKFRYMFYRCETYIL